MKALWVLGMAVGVSMAQADRGPLFPEPKSPFDFMGEYFKAGDVPDEKTLTGWHSGRCFNEAEPERAHGGILVFFDNSGKAAPTGLSLLNWEMSNVFYALTPSNLFDPGIFDEVRLKAVQRSLANWKAGVPEDATDKSSYELGKLEKRADFWEMTNKWEVRGIAESSDTTQIRLKTYKGYFITEARTTSKRGKEGAVEYHDLCYYFAPIDLKKVKPAPAK